MAEAVASETPETVTEGETTNTQDMDVEAPEPSQPNDSGSAHNVTDGDSNSKRVRKGAGEEEDANDTASKKQKVEKSVEEERLEKLEDAVAETGRLTLGPKTFGCSIEMFDHFFKFLHYWPTNLNVNKYEHIILLELLKKGHTEPDKKIGGGIHAFQVRYHPMFKSRCFFILRDDESVDDFSFRKCVDHISPLPENMKPKSDVNKALGGGGRGGSGGRGGGRGRGGNWRGGRGRN